MFFFFFNNSILLDKIKILNHCILGSGKIRENSDYNFMNFEDEDINSIDSELTGDEQTNLLDYDEKYEFPPENLMLGKPLGNGAFGVVYKATAKRIRPYEEETTVAVKMVRRVASYEVGF